MPLTAEENKYFETRGAMVPGVATVEEKPAPPAEPEKKEPTAEPAQPAAQPAEKPEGEESDPDNKGKFIRHGAFHEEREKRKALERQVQEERENRARLEGQFEEFRQRMVREAPQEEPKPSDPLEELAELKRFKQTIETNAQQSAGQQQFLNTYGAAVQSFIKGEDGAPAVEDFPDAYRHLMKSRAEELKATGLYTDQRVQQILDYEESGIVSAAFERRTNPAAIMYKLAEARGYKRANGAAPAAAQAAAPAAPSPAEKLAQVAAGQAAAKSLSSAAGGPSAPITLASVANMSRADFAKNFTGPDGEKRWKELWSRA